MTATVKIDPSRLPAPLLPATHSIRRDPIPRGLPIIELPQVMPMPAPKPPKNKGKKQVTVNKLWTPERDEILEEMYSTAASDKEIGERLGLSPDQVARRIHARKDKGTLPDRPKRMFKSWTGEEEALLIDLYTEGENFAEIAEKLHKTIGATQTRAYELRKAGKLSRRNHWAD